MYQMYQAQVDIAAPIRAFARSAVSLLRNPLTEAWEPFGLRAVTAAYEMIARAGITHERPAFGIDAVRVGEEDVPVYEEVADVTPFATLLHFRRAHATPLPRVLVVAPMSGHFATLLRATVRTMLPEHDVYLTDWHNARDVSVADGRFGADEYVDHVIRFLEKIGPGAHVVAVCQPCVPVLAAVAIMSEQRNDARPHSMTLMAGPIDARVNETAVGKLAASHPIEWFERNLIATVPLRYRGANRRVYPGFIQLSAFVSMNLQRHLDAHRDLYEALAAGDESKAKGIAGFYDEYFAVADLPAEFYLETVQTIFQDYALANGTLTWHGHRVDTSAIESTALLTVEGERDDVCGIGQTMAAQDLCSGIRPFRKRHHLQAGVGHYGVFSGNRWTRQIYPVLRNVILAAD
jgi:poly(3-hydroxybutyrate) depolymerase